MGAQDIQTLVNADSLDLVGIGVEIREIEGDAHGASWSNDPHAVVDPRKIRPVAVGDKPFLRRA